MVKSVYVRGPTLARLAMVLVLLSIGNTPALRVITLQARRSVLYELCRASGKPSTGFPLGTRRAEPAFLFFPKKSFNLVPSNNNPHMKINV